MMTPHGLDSKVNARRCQQQRQRRRQWSEIVFRVVPSIALLILSSTTVVVIAADTSDNSSSSSEVKDCPPNYSGFSLKPNSSCTQYVLCANGTPSSIMSCPFGLLYSGKIGKGGICDWAATVVCVADEDEEEIVGLSSPSAAGSDADAVEAPDVSTTTSTAKATSATVVPTATTQPPSIINPSNFYCGTSAEDASNSCVPCPGGTFEECNKDGSFSKGCFKGIDAKCNGDGKTGTTSTATVGTTTSTTTTASTTTHDDAADNNDGMTNWMETQPEQLQAAPIDENDEFNTQPSDYDLQPSPRPTVPPRPTLNPTLPPWTNAPFVPSPSSSSSFNQKTIIGYYASWQWYDRNKFADPNNIDYSKYTRIHYAFFQPDEGGNLYGTDEWGDPQILWGPYATTTNSEGGNARTRRRKMAEGGGSGGDNNYKCSWDGPNVKNCNYHDLNRGLLHLAQAAGVQVMPSIGGWTLSDNFPAIAADEELREHFAKQCVELIVAYGFDGEYLRLHT
jgi:hypothetical protein